MTDLTTITSPFGLLDRETQEALKAHGGPWEYWNGGSWTNSASETLHDIDTALTYRAKPAPPKPREWWVVLTDGNRGIALPWEPNAPQGPVVHVREVLPE
jgi:hypothetical protein